MPRVSFEGQEYIARPGETVLDCLTRHGVSVNSSCGVGICQTCMMVAIEGEPGTASQAGLQETLKAQNYFLICSCVPENDITVGNPDQGARYFQSQVMALDRLTREVVRLRLQLPDNYNYLPGQFLALYSAEGISRSYSLASVPCLDDYLELHIRIIPDGRVSGWVSQLRPGVQVKIDAATGQCAYAPGRPGQPLIMVGTGTGLAPLLGIARDALQQGHHGPIHLYHGSSKLSGLYLHEMLAGLAGEFPDFHYHPCVSRGEMTDKIRAGRADENALADFPDLSGWRVFLCGNEAMVKGMQRKAFLAGASMQDIFADPFNKPVNRGAAREVAQPAA